MSVFNVQSLADFKEQQSANFPGIRDVFTDRIIYALGMVEVIGGGLQMWVMDFVERTFLLFHYIQALFTEHVT